MSYTHQQVSHVSTVFVGCVGTGMLIILMQRGNNNTLAKGMPIPITILLLKRIANTNTNTFVTILFTG